MHVQIPLEYPFLHIFKGMIQLWYYFLHITNGVSTWSLSHNYLHNSTIVQVLLLCRAIKFYYIVIKYFIMKGWSNNIKQWRNSLRAPLHTTTLYCGICGYLLLRGGSICLVSIKCLTPFLKLWLSLSNLGLTLLQLHWKVSAQLVKLFHFHCIPPILLIMLTC